jgi:hypothetical protein
MVFGFFNDAKVWVDIKKAAGLINSPAAFVL